MDLISFEVDAPNGISSDFKDINERLATGSVTPVGAAGRYVGKTAQNVAFGAGRTVGNVAGGVGETAVGLVDGLKDTVVSPVQKVGQLKESVSKGEMHPVAGVVAAPVVVVGAVVGGAAKTVGNVGKGVGKTIGGVFKGVGSIF